MLSNYLNWGLNFLQSEFGGSEFVGSEFVIGGLSRLYIRILLCSKESESSFRCYWELLIFIPPSCLQPCRWTNCLEILVLPSGTGSSRHAQEPSAWPHPLTTKKQNNNNNKNKPISLPCSSRNCRPCELPAGLPFCRMPLSTNTKPPHTLLGYPWHH